MSHQVDEFFLGWQSFDVSSSLFTSSHLFRDETFACSTAPLRGASSARMSSFQAIFASTLKNHNGAHNARNELKIGTNVPHFNVFDEKNYKNIRSVRIV
jgi:hypothetical protein